MGIVDVVSALAKAPALLQLKKAMAPQPPETPGCWSAWIENNAAEIPNNSAIVFEGQELHVTPP